MSTNVDDNKAAKGGCSTVGTGIYEASRPEPTTKENTAHAILLSRRRLPTLIPITTPRNKETKTFGEIYLATSEAELATVSPSPTPTLVSASAAATTISYTKIPTMQSKKPKPVPVESTPPTLPSAIAKNTAVQDPHQEPTHRRMVLEKFHPPHLNVDKEEFGQDVAEHNLKTLQDSRWAKDDLQGGGQHSRAQRDSRRADVFGDAPPERNPARGNAERKFRRKKDPRRDVAEHDPKTPTKNQRWAKEDEAPRELPRVHVDKEEFSRDVAEDNLKTLKDSRWA